MFGHDDKNDDNQQTIDTKPVNPGLLGIDEDTESSVAPEPAIIAPSAPALPQVSDPVASNPVIPDPATVSPVTPSQDDQATANPTTLPEDTIAPTLAPVLNTTEDSASQVSESISNDQLIAIKRQALLELSPLIDHLDQSSEEKFKTTMMMIQASDNKDLISQAFNSAKDIPDSKRRAQALLDLINEINYFTHKTEA